MHIAIAATAKAETISDLMYVTISSDRLNNLSNDPDDGLLSQICIEYTRGYPRAQPQRLAARHVSLDGSRSMAGFVFRYAAYWTQ